MEKKVENGVLSIVDFTVEKLRFLAELKIEYERVHKRKKELKDLKENEYSSGDWNILFSNIDEQISRLENISTMYNTSQHNEEEQINSGTEFHYDDVAIKEEVTSEDDYLDYHNKVDLILTMHSDQEKLELFYFVSGLEGECKRQNDEGFPEYVHPEFFAKIVASLNDADLKVRALEQLKIYFESEDYVPETETEEEKKSQRDEGIACVVVTLRNPDVMMKYYREVDEIEARLTILEAISQLPEYQRELTIEEMQEVVKRITQKIKSAQTITAEEIARDEIEARVLMVVKKLADLKSHYESLIETREN